MTKKRTLLYALMALTFAFAAFTSGGCGGGSDVPEAGDIIEASLAAQLSSADLASMDAKIESALSDEAKMESASSAMSVGSSAKSWSWLLKRYQNLAYNANTSGMSNGGISSIKLSYWTKNQMGMLVSAQAAVFIPHTIYTQERVPIFAIQHPTEIERKNSPSKLVNFNYYNIKDPNQLQMHLAALIARSGYIVVVADYLGMGDNQDIHPYCQELLAYNIIHAIDSAKDIRVDSWFKQSLWDGKKIMLMGFSEGGYATMMTAKKLQTEYQTEFPITAAACIDGPYSLSETMREVMLTADKTFPSPYFLPYTLNAYSAQYGDKIPEFKFSASVRNDIPKYKTTGYPAVLQAAMDGYHDSDYIDNLMIEPLSPDSYFGPRSILSPEFFDLLSDDESIVCKTMAKNNSYEGWKPDFPLLMYHHVSDDLVPHGNLVEAKAAFEAAGVLPKNLTVSSATDYTIFTGKVMHINAFLPGLFTSFYWLDSYAYGDRFDDQ